MWAYVIYISVGANSYKIMSMLVPWLFLFGYLKLLPRWDYTATVAASTPIFINLGRLYAKDLPPVDYVIHRIQQNVIGIGLGIIFTICIVPKFAVILLKINTRGQYISHPSFPFSFMDQKFYIDTLGACRQATESMHSIYDQFFHHQHPRQSSIKIDQTQVIQSLFGLDRRHFYELISVQQTLITSASREPTFCWLNYAFSVSRYHILRQQQWNIYRILHSLDTTVSTRTID